MTQTPLQRPWPKALLLDFYGTLVEDDEAMQQACARVAAASPLTTTAAEVGAHWSALFARLCHERIGDAFRPQNETGQYSLELVLERFQARLDAAAMSRTLEQGWARPTLYPEVRDVLAACALPNCVISNIDNAELRSALRHTGLAFDHVVTSEDCRAYKPRPEMFQRALALLGLQPREVLHVGDSLGSDVRGARAMGIPVLWINRNGRPVPTGDNAPDYVAADLRGLIDLLGQV